MKFRKKTQKISCQRNSYFNIVIIVFFIILLNNTNYIYQKMTKKCEWSCDMRQLVIKHHCNGDPFGLSQKKLIYPFHSLFDYSEMECNRFSE